MTLHEHLRKQLILKPKEDNRIFAGHPWVFSNEVREMKGAPLIGDVVELLNAGGISLGVGFYNPHSLIAFRMLAPTIAEIDAGFFRDRLRQAQGLRDLALPGATAYRLVHGEGDFLPGLVIDRYNDIFSVQTLSYGMDQRLPLIIEALQEMFHPSVIVERNESPLRVLENLSQKKGVLFGEGSPTVTTISEHGLEYAVDVLEGQKTGFFLDQRENRAVASRYAKGARVLDCFCNDGGFSLNAARAGALSVLGIDVSADAAARASANAKRNAISSARFETADVFERLALLAGSSEQFDLVILDPPSFTRSRKNVAMAKKGYRDLHLAAFKVLAPGGILLTASCSHHIEPDVFLDIIDDASRRAGKKMQMLDWRGAAPDHPTLAAVPETRYLKFAVFRVLSQPKGDA